MFNGKSRDAALDLCKTCFTICNAANVFGIAGLKCGLRNEDAVVTAALVDIRTTHCVDQTIGMV